MAHLKILWGYRELLWLWTWRAIQARYKQTLLGGFWAVLQPLALMIIFSIIFSRILRIDTGDIAYPIFSYTAILPWTFFTAALTEATSSLVVNMQLVSKIYFPREIFPLAAIGSKLVDFFIASLVFVGLLVIYQIPVSILWLWLPLLLAIQLLLTIGLGLLFACVTVFFRDVRHGIVLFLQLWMYATPIIYPLTLVPERYQGWYALNPMVGLIESYRAVILHGTAPTVMLLGPAVVVSGVVFVLGYTVFKRFEWQFGDII